MIEHTQTNKLVVMTLEGSGCALKATQLYSEIKEEAPHIMRQEKIHSFKSFTRVLVTFKDVKPIDSRPKMYTLKKI